jgi:signal transduction histidine kinase
MVDMDNSQDLARAEPVWRRTVVGWHFAFWCFLGLMVVTTFIADVTTTVRVGFLGLLAVLGLAYLLLGQPATTSRSRWRAHAYRLILVAVCGTAAAFFPQSLFLLFLAFPQIWMLSTRVREAVIYSVLVLLADAAGLYVAASGSWVDFRGSIPWLLVSLTMSLLMGIWIEQVIKQSERRAELIAELDQTREELAQANHAAGAMAERERMAREIHDTLAQGMTSIVMLAQAAQAELAAGRPTDKLAAIEDTARENLAEARALVAAFTPVALAESTLTEVLRRQAERFRTETGVDVQVRLDLPDEDVAALPAGQQVVLLRAAQEALANVRKHAGAEHVLITLGASAGDIRIEICDDGRGFEPAAVDGAGFGLAAMRGRVEESGGSVEVVSTPGGGTRVQVLVPAAPEV